MNCQRCGSEIAQSRIAKGAKYCSQACATKAHNGWYVPSKYGLSPATTGAIGEMLVATDLLRKGFSVFQAVSPACFCDLIAIKDSLVLKIEVRTAVKYKGGDRLYYVTKPRGEVDLFALLVADTDEVVYRPSLESFSSSQ